MAVNRTKLTVRHRPDQAARRLEQGQDDGDRHQSGNLSVPDDREIRLGLNVCMKYCPASMDRGRLLKWVVLVLVGVVVLAGLLALFYWVAAMLPASLACPELDGCLAPRPDENQAGWVDGRQIDGPRMTP
jgi:hypothetical protein